MHQSMAVAIAPVTAPGQQPTHLSCIPPRCLTAPSILHHIEFCDIREKARNQSVPMAPSPPQ